MGTDLCSKRSPPSSEPNAPRAACAPHARGGGGGGAVGAFSHGDSAAAKNLTANRSGIDLSTCNQKTTRGGLAKISSGPPGF